MGRWRWGGFHLEISCRRSEEIANGFREASDSGGWRGGWSVKGQVSRVAHTGLD